MGQRDYFGAALHMIGGVFVASVGLILPSLFANVSGDWPEALRVGCIIIAAWSVYRGIQTLRRQ